MPRNNSSRGNNNNRGNSNSRPSGGSSGGRASGGSSGGGGGGGGRGASATTRATFAASNPNSRTAATRSPAPSTATPYQAPRTKSGVKDQESQFSNFKAVDSLNQTLNRLNAEKGGIGYGALESAGITDPRTQQYARDYAVNNGMRVGDQLGKDFAGSAVEDTTLNQVFRPLSIKAIIADGSVRKKELGGFANKKGISRDKAALRIRNQFDKKGLTDLGMNLGFGMGALKAFAKDYEKNNPFSAASARTNETGGLLSKLGGRKGDMYNMYRGISGFDKGQTRTGRDNVFGFNKDGSLFQADRMPNLDYLNKSWLNPDMSQMTTPNFDPNAGGSPGTTGAEPMPPEELPPEEQTPDAGMFGAGDSVGNLATGWRSAKGRRVLAGRGAQGYGSMIMKSPNNYTAVNV